MCDFRRKTALDGSCFALVAVFGIAPRSVWYLPPRPSLTPSEKEQKLTATPTPAAKPTPDAEVPAAPDSDGCLRKPRRPTRRP